MRIREDYELSELTSFGFEFCTDEDEDWDLRNKYFYNLGHARRGQFYYLIVNEGENRRLDVYASRPDGDGTKISLGDVLFDLIEKGVVVR